MSRVPKVLAYGVFAALLISPADGFAQAGRAGAPAANGPPRSILPARPVPDETPVPDADAQGPQDETQPELAPPPQTAAPQRPGAAVEIGDLGTIEGPVAGLLDDSNGGLGYDMWQGTTRAATVGTLQSVPPATPSDAARLLLRKILLTAAPPPAGDAASSFSALRLNKLIAAGLADDAADLALKMQAPMNPEILRAQADSLLYAGRDKEACSDLTAYRLQSAEPFWAELRAYCYSLARDARALELTRAVIDEQGIVDPAFLMLLDGLASGKGTAPEMFHLPDVLQLFILSRLKLPVSIEMANALGLSASLSAAASRETPRLTRMAAGERALRAGVLPTPLLTEILDLTKFTPQELAGASALARNEPLINALSRLRAGLKATTSRDTRADLIHTAFQIGEREGLLAQVSQLFADDAEAIVPLREWNTWSDLMMRGLLLAGRPEAAARWYGILDANAPDTADAVIQLELALALSSPDSVDQATTEGNLTALAIRSSDAQSPVLLSRATLALGLYDALGRDMPPEAQAAVQLLVSRPSPGRRPTAALMQRIDKAALTGARGDLTLSVVAALDAQGARDLAPDVVVRLVRALQTGGIKDGALALASEAILLRSATGG